MEGTKRVFVRNTSQRDIKEFKPGLGTFLIPAQKELEIEDLIDYVETPIKTKVPFVRYTARTIADSIVKDYAMGHLEIIEREG